ncbi:MAG: hypothetical protein QW699_01665 [Metallosphaera sp.]|uniref:hypothetical protein n=1 Tax=Metallosphaera sp. TaxID=2020860 RepID=UPI00316226D4
MITLFDVKIGVRADPQQIREIFKEMPALLEDLCVPSRIGASYLCSPSSSSLIIVYLAEQEMRPIHLAFRIKSSDSKELVRYSEKISEKLKNYGVHPTLLSTDSVSL